MTNPLQLLLAANEPDADRTLALLLEISKAERGFLVLREAGEFRVSSSRGMSPEEVESAHAKVSRTLLARALEEGLPVVATDAEMDGIASLQAQKVRSVCAIPLRRCDGAIYLDSRSRPGLFAELKDLSAVANQLDKALHARGPVELGGLAGQSPPMRALKRLLEKARESPYPVLITGESGTGKELAARALHRRGPFVAANCAVLPESLIDAELFGSEKGSYTGAERDRAGLFEQADGGTLFLDEIGCLTPAAQESFLRVLETGEFRPVGGSKTLKVQVRVVAATNEDLERAEGFRRDLYYRLNVLRIEMPPLRDRREDIPELAQRFLARIQTETRASLKILGPEAVEVLRAYAWPGNARELLNALRRAASLAESDQLKAEDFAFLKRPTEAAAPGAVVSLDEHIRETLLRFGGKMEIQEIADRLGVSRKTLWEKKKKWGL